MKTKYITHTAIIASMYIVLTLISNAFGLASGFIQFRISEALVLLPFITPAAIPGLTIGCLLANILTGCSILDILFGTLATFLAAICVYLVRNGKLKLVSSAFPILFNSLIVALVYWITTSNHGFWFYFLTVFIGEFVCCGILGTALYLLLYKLRNKQTPPAKTEV